MACMDEESSVLSSLLYGLLCPQKPLIPIISQHHIVTFSSNTQSLGWLSHILDERIRLLALLISTRRIDKTVVSGVLILYNYAVRLIIKC